ncbi:MAG: T9SS type A sorting domain-containing protein [Flavobacteriaceae bacterium]|nr:T9SS type A sorting domain-containing protein [Flavobacteriaceae bacterium]
MRNLFLLVLLATITTAQSQTIDVYGPQNFNEILANSFTKSWTPTAISSIENFKYIIFLDASTKSNAMSIDSSDPTKINVINTDDIHTSGATHNSLLSSIFQFVDVNSNSTGSLSGTYIIKPLMQSYFAIDDSNTSEAVISDAGSFYANTASQSSYVAIEFTGTSSTTKVKAVDRYVYNSTTSTYEVSTSWSDKWLKINGTAYEFTNIEGDATEFFLADATDLIDLQIPQGSDFNPISIDWQENEWAAYPTDVWDYDNSTFYGSMFLNDIADVYETQFGTSTTADAAATSALDAIEVSLTTEGNSLRYDKSTYLEFRKNLLGRTFASSDIYNGKYGASTVANVYFTNAKDDFGVSHPFMVIASHNVSDSPNYLIDVARPPGDGTPGTQYPDQTITRNAVLEAQLNKIPLKDYGLVSSLTENDLTTYGSLAEDEGVSSTDYDVYNYTSTASCGIAIDGVVIYPAYNNGLRFAAIDAEITKTGIHVGRGMGLHYHADGHSFSGNGLNLYNLNDYDSKDHPPLIAFAYDGIALFGKYETSHSSMKGYAISLDEYGGHDHDGFGYHYHTFSEQYTHSVTDPGPGGGTTVYTPNQHFLLVGAWRGNINNIPGFLQGSNTQLVDPDYGRYAGAFYTGLSVEDTVFSNQLSLYPNPSKGVFTLKSDELISEILVTDITGIEIMRMKYESFTIPLDISKLKYGFYILKIKGQNGSASRKIIIE